MTGDETKMTVEQAIRLLDPRTTGAAVAEIEYYNGFSGRTAAVQAISNACELACKIMREHEQVKRTMSNDNVRAILDEIRAFKRAAEKFANHDYMTGYLSALSALEGFIAGLPAVEAAPVVHGRWIHCDGKSNLWHCSECGGRIMYSQTRKTYNIIKLPVSEANKFCKHCGAKMDKEEEKHGSD